MPLTDFVKKRPEIASADLTWLGLVFEKVQSLEDGEILLSVKSAKITRLDTTSRMHLPKNRPASVAEPSGQSAGAKD